MLATARWPARHDQDEFALAALPDGAPRILFIPALLGEANKMRRFTVQTMRALAERQIGSILPDLPGTNESLAPLSQQTLAGWQSVMAQAADHFRATHVATIRGGCLLAPKGLPLLSYAPLSGGSLMKAMLRIQSISEREAGREVTRDQLDIEARSNGLRIAGYDLSAALYTGLSGAEPIAAERSLAAGDLGGPGLWLRAEPSEAPDQSQRFAQLLAGWVG